MWTHLLWAFYWVPSRVISAPGPCSFFPSDIRSSLSMLWGPTSLWRGEGHWMAVARWWAHAAMAVPKTKQMTAGRRAWCGAMLWSGFVWIPTWRADASGNGGLRSENTAREREGPETESENTRRAQKWDRGAETRLQRAVRGWKRRERALLCWW